MKQRIHGQKVQNWHRPLGADELKQSYRVRRDEDPEYPDVTVLNRGITPGFVEDEWYDEYYDDYPGPWRYAGESSADELKMFELAVLVREMFQPGLLHEGCFASQGEADCADFDERFSESDRRLELRLQEHLQQISDPAQHAQLLRRLRETRVLTAELDVVSKACLKWANEYLQTLLYLFLPFWIRSPLAWRGRTPTSLVKHLLHRHPVPVCLESVWRMNPDHYVSLVCNTNWKWHVWSIVLGQGGSLKQASRHFPWQASGKLQFHLENAPMELTPLEACLRAEVLRLGGTDIDFERINDYSVLRVDPTELDAQEEMTRFWYDTVRWVIAHRSELTEDTCHSALDWGMHRFTEDRLNFSWKGRTVAAVLHQVALYERLRHSTCYQYRNRIWQGHGWNWTWKTEDGTWSIVELMTGWQLVQEGRQLRHCVGGYVSKCENGHSAILSLRWNDELRITIQVELRTLQVIQARGLCNRPVTAEENRIIQRWSNEMLQPSAEDASQINGRIEMMVR